HRQRVTDQDGTPRRPRTYHPRFLETHRYPSPLIPIRVSDYGWPTRALRPGGNPNHPERLPPHPDHNREERRLRRCPTLSKKLLRKRKVRETRSAQGPNPQPKQKSIDGRAIEASCTPRFAMEAMLRVDRDRQAPS